MTMTVDKTALDLAEERAERAERQLAEVTRKHDALLRGADHAIAIATAAREKRPGWADCTCDAADKTAAGQHEHGCPMDIIWDGKPLYTMLKASGTVIDVLHPKPETILIGDIIQCLSNEARFCGDIDYTVLGHSLVVAWLARQAMIDNFGCHGQSELARRVFRTGQLHDGSEAYCRDLPRDLKRSFGNRLEGYIAAEKRFMAAITERFDLDRGDYAWLIKMADDEALAAEIRLFWPPYLWPHFRTGEPSSAALRLTSRFASLDKNELRAEFHYQFEESLRE